MRVPYFKTKAAVSFALGVLGVFISSAPNQPQTTWQWVVLCACSLSAGLIAFKAYLLDPNKEDRP